jgi:hypothetical protein
MKGYKNSTKTVYEAEPMAAYKRGGYVEKGSGAVKAPAAKAVHKHERSMHPGKPLTKMQKGGKVGC